MQFRILYVVFLLLSSLSMFFCWLTDIEQAPRELAA